MINMSNTIFSHEFSVGDKAHSLYLKQDVKILSLNFLHDGIGTRISYVVMFGLSSSTLVMETDLIPLSKSASQPQPTATNTPPVGPHTYTVPPVGSGTYTTLTGGTVTATGTIYTSTIQF